MSDRRSRTTIRNVAAGAWLLSVATLLASCTSQPAIPESEFARVLRASDIERIESWLQRDGVPWAHTTPEGRNALMVAAGAGRADLVEALLERGLDARGANDRGGTPLMYAAVSGDLSTLRSLHAAGAEPNAVASNGWTAITLAAAKGHVDAVRYLLSIGADPNIPDMYGWTALMRAVEQRRHDTVRLLLDSPRVDVDAVNDSGATALFRAVVSGDSELVRALLSRGADPRRRDFAGRSPEDVAAQLGHERLQALLRDTSGN